MAIPFNVPEEATPNSTRSPSSTSATPSNVPAATSAASSSTSTTQPPSPVASAGGSGAQLPPMIHLNREYVMLAFMEAAQRYYRDTQGGLSGYYCSEPTSPAYFQSSEESPNSLTDRFYGTPMTSNGARRNRSNSLPVIRAHLSSRSRDVNNNVVNNNNNNVYEEDDDDDDDEYENVPRRFAKDLKARQNMQEFSGCIPKRRNKKMFEQQQDKSEIPQQHDAIGRDDNTRDDDCHPKDVIALSLILFGALAIGFGLIAARKI